MKSITNLLKQDKEKFIPPKSVQDVIPIKTIYKDGIFQVGRNKYSKSYKFTDINYAVASNSDQETMFLKYSELLNSLDPCSTCKITILNRKFNKVDFEQDVKIPLANDGLDGYREEYNEMLMDKALGSNSIIQEKYFTISINKRNVDEARSYFNRTSADLTRHFNQLGSRCIEQSATDRLRVAHDFYRVGEESMFCWDMLDDMRKGHSFKDYICPDTFSFKKDYFEMGNKFGRVFFLKDYARYIKDKFVAELTELNKHMILSIDAISIPTEEAIRDVENIKLGVEANITNWQRKQNNNNNFSAVIPYNMEQQREEAKDVLDDLTTRDQRIFVCTLTIVLLADTKEELDQNTESLLSTGRKHLCQLAILKYQQMDGLNTSMMYGVKKIETLRTLTTEALATFIPFKVQEIFNERGIYYGNNLISKNIILADRRELLNGNSFILGVSGSGKSFAAKNEIVSIALRDANADILVIDPENEYRDLIHELKGEVIKISATSNNHINTMDINADYGDGDNPLILKSEFLLSFCEMILDGKKLGAKEKSIIDRCASKVYRAYLQGNYQGVTPTLQDFRDELLKQEEPEAKQIALTLEMYADGSLNTFAKETNVNTNSRILCYDIHDLGKQLRPIGMLVVLDSILNRITSNKSKGRNTYIFIDEIYLLFQHEYSANFLFTLWKRVRKYGAFCTGITQNVDDLLQSHTARTMLANSEFIIILSQAATDSIELAKLIAIPDEQMRHITSGGTGRGLLKVGNALVPFQSEFPKDTKLYKLMTTKINE